MLASERNKLATSIFRECLRVLDGKGTEYAGSKDCLANFKRLGYILNCSPSIVAFIYLIKHCDAIHSYATRGNNSTPSGEPFLGRIVDAINYLFLLACLEAERGSLPPPRRSRRPRPAHV